MLAVHRLRADHDGADLGDQDAGHAAVQARATIEGPAEADRLDREWADQHGAEELAGRVEVFGLHVRPAEQVHPGRHRHAGRLDGAALLAQITLDALQLGQPFLGLLGGALGLLVLRPHLAHEDLVIEHEGLGDGLGEPLLPPRQLGELRDQGRALAGALRGALVGAEAVEVGAQHLGREGVPHRAGDGAVQIGGGHARRVRAGRLAAHVAA